MLISFAKYQGSGNDFIIIDDRSCSFPWQDRSAIVALTSRCLGVGGDGLLLLQPSLIADFRMRIFNVDGSEASMCGNGLCCLVSYIKNLGFSSSSFAIETGRGVLSCGIEGDHVTIAMPTPRLLGWDMRLEGLESYPLFVVDTGVPHGVCVVENLEEFPLENIGPLFRFHPYFSPEGINMNVMEPSSDGTLRIRTYERGVEGETLSCGTGACAAAVVYHQQTAAATSLIRMMPKSGVPLEFFLENTLQGCKVVFRGSGCFVFEGRISVASA